MEKFGKVNELSLVPWNGFSLEKNDGDKNTGMKLRNGEKGLIPSSNYLQIRTKNIIPASATLRKAKLTKYQT